MSDNNRPSTPPRPTATGNTPLTPEQVRRLEINRLKSKALRDQPTSSSQPPKRPHSAISQTTTTSRNHRDARTPGAQAGEMAQPSDDAQIRPAAKYRKSAYIEYDLSAMTDTKGGFLSATDDPHNKALHGSNRGKDEDEKPAHMTLEEWQRHRLLQKLRATKSGPFEPGISVLDKDEGGGKSKQPLCRECGTPEIDWTFQTTFNLLVCNRCKEEHPDKYSLLTKTEAREDYLLTDPELRDEDLLPRMERPNPHKASFHSMQLFVRCQVEEYAFSARKWGSPEALDAEFERREVQKKERKEKKWKNKLEDLKKRTRVDAYRRQKAAGLAAAGDGREAQFGDKVKGRFDKHEHEWGRAVEDAETGAVKKTCIECGMQVEELEF